MNKLEKTKQDVINRFSGLMDELFSSNLFSEIDEINLKISEQSDKLSKIKNEYSDTENAYANMKIQWYARESDLKNREQVISERENSITERESKIEEELSIASDEVINKVSIRNKLILEIAELEKKVASLTSASILRDNLSLELINVKNDLIEATRNLDSIKTEYMETVNSINRIKTLAQKDLEDIKINKEKELQYVLPTMRELEERKISLDKREASIQTIVERWKKLYADKGVGFKV